MKSRQKNTCGSAKACYKSASAKSGSEPMHSNHKASEENFKILRAADPAIVGATKPLQMATEVHFPNARGGLRLVNTAEVRTLASHSAQTLLKALGKA
jgi:hypothetical protein